MRPTVRLWFAGATATDRRRADVTVRDAFPDSAPDVAVMFALPAATAVARPPALTVAAALLDEVQMTPLDKAEDVPSEKVPTTTNC